MDKSSAVGWMHDVDSKDERRAYIRPYVVLCSRDPSKVRTHLSPAVAVVLLNGTV